MLAGLLYLVRASVSHPRALGEPIEGGRQPLGGSGFEDRAVGENHALGLKGNHLANGILRRFATETKQGSDMRGCCFASAPYGADHQAGYGRKPAAFQILNEVAKDECARDPMIEIDLAEAHAAPDEPLINLRGPCLGSCVAEILVDPRSSTADLRSIAQSWHGPGHSSGVDALPLRQVDPVGEGRCDEMTDGANPIQAFDQLGRSPGRRMKEQFARRRITVMRIGR